MRVEKVVLDLFLFITGFPSKSISRSILLNKFLQFILSDFPKNLLGDSLKQCDVDNKNALNNCLFQIVEDIKPFMTTGETFPSCSSLIYFFF